MGEITAFPNGISSFGSTLPSSFGVQSGQSLFVDVVNGNDGNPGNAPGNGNALSTLARALQLCVAGRGDIVYLISDGSTAATARPTATLDWNKANTHLIGVCAPGPISQRARIANATSTSGVTPLVKFSAAGCYIANLQIFLGYTTDEDQIACELAVGGTRCTFNNVQFAGMGDTVPAARAGSMSIKLGGAENWFTHCTIGLDTISRTTTNSEMGITVGTRNVFDDCLFITYAGSAGHLYMSAAASTIDRFILFRRCTFINAIQSGATTMTAAMSINGTGSPAGMALLDDCKLYGATYWVAADTAKVMLSGPTGAANSQLYGIARTADLP